MSTLLTSLFVGLGFKLATTQKERASPARRSNLPHGTRYAAPSAKLNNLDNVIGFCLDQRGLHVDIVGKSEITSSIFPVNFYTFT